jgi:hypothetical protein
LLVSRLEAKDFITDIDQVAGLQNGALHPLPVDERAVGAAQVVDDESRAFTSNMGVVARGARTGDHHGIICCTPDGERLVSQSESASDQGAANAGKVWRHGRRSWLVSVSLLVYRWSVIGKRCLYKRDGEGIAILFRCEIKTGSAGARQ